MPANDNDSTQKAFWNNDLCDSVDAVAQEFGKPPAEGLADPCHRSGCDILACAIFHALQQ